MAPYSEATTEESSTNSVDKPVSNSSRSITTKKISKSVTFKLIEVREYERVLGDHPDTTLGPPISIGWGFVEHDAVDLDEYESQRKKSGIKVLLAHTRRRILRDVYGYSDKELRKAEVDVSRIFYQRSQTKSLGKFDESCEELCEKATKSIKKFGRNLTKSVIFKRGGSVR
jgi:hypothetical protein